MRDPGNEVVWKQDLFSIKGTRKGRKGYFSCFNCGIQKGKELGLGVETPRTKLCRVPQPPSPGILCTCCRLENSPYQPFSLLSFVYVLCPGQDIVFSSLDSTTLSLTVTTNAVIASIKMPCAIFKLSLWHNTRLGKMLITIFRLWITDELTHRTLAQAAFRSNVDYPLVCYLLTDGLVRTVGREFCCRNETIRRQPWVRHFSRLWKTLQYYYKVWIYGGIFKKHTKHERRCFIGISKNREESWKYDGQRCILEVFG